MIRKSFFVMLLASIMLFNAVGCLTAMADAVIYDKEIFSEGFEDGKINYLLAHKGGYDYLLPPRVVSEKDEGIGNGDNKFVRIEKESSEEITNHYFRLRYGDSEAVSIHNIFDGNHPSLKQVKLTVSVYSKDKLASFDIKCTDSLDKNTTETLITFKSGTINFADGSTVPWTVNTWYSLEFYIDFSSGKGIYDVKVKYNGQEVIKENLVYSNEATCVTSFGVIPKGTGSAYVIYADDFGYYVPSENIAEDVKLYHMSLSEKEKSDIFAALDGSVAVADFAGKAIKNGSVINLSENEILTTDESGSIGTTDFYKKVFDASVSGSLLTAYGKTIDFTEIKTVYDGEIYLPVEKVLDELLIEYEIVDGVFIIGENSVGTEDIKNLKTLLFSNDLSYEDITSDDWKEIKDRWRKFLLGDEKSDFSDPWVAGKVSDIDNACDAALSIYNPDSNVLALFGETPVTTTREMTYQYEYMYDMARAYGTYGSKYYKDEDVKNKVLYALGWLYDNLYGEDEINGKGWKRTSDYNWSDWFEKTPRALANTMLIVEDDLTPELIKKYLSLYFHLRVKMKNTLTPSHALSRMYTGALSAALCEDFDRMRDMTAEYGLNLDTHSVGNGIQEDWQYITHNYFAYTSIYGTEALLGRIPKLYEVLHGTKFEFDLPQNYNMCNWIYETFDPVMFYGHFTNAQAGRAHGNEASNTGYAISTALDLIGKFGKDDDAKLKQFIKRHTTDYTLNYILKDLEINQVEKLRKVLEETETPESAYFSKIYYTGDSVMHHRGNFGFSLSMSSTRIAKWESINGANGEGWYRGDGMLYMHLESDPSYGSSFFTGVNWYHLPGTTVDTQERVSASIANSAEVLGTQDFVGGAGIDNLYSTAAMQFEDYNNDNKDAVVETDSEHGGDAPFHQSSLMAKKAWFMFDDELVALGADINANDGFEVHTVVENRKLKKFENPVFGAEDITVDGTLLEKATTYRKSFENPVWAHIEGVSGYYFPQGGKLEMDKVSTNSNFLEMWMSHGISPRKSTYAYVLLPTKTAEETAAYSETPDIEIISNTEKLQAVKETKLGLCGMVFWEEGAFENIKVSKPMILMTQNDGEEYKIGLSDPTKLQKTATVEIYGNYDLVGCDEHLTVTKDDDKTVITIVFDGANGRTLDITLKVKHELNVFENNGTVYVSAFSPDADATLFVVKYQGDMIADIKTLSAVPGADYSFSAEKGTSYRFFLFKKGSMEPVCGEKSYGY